MTFLSYDDYTWEVEFQFIIDVGTTVVRSIGTLNDYQATQIISTVLSVINEAQYHARELAVELGFWRFNKANSHLKEIKKVVNQGPDIWHEWASSYELDNSGNPIPFRK